MRVLLTRPRAQSERLESVLLAHGMACLTEPMLEIVPTHWDPAVLDGCQAVLVTSANASHALLGVPRACRVIPVLAVGEATASPLIEAGFTNVHAAGGTATSLIEHVRHKLDPVAGPVVYLSGLHVSCDLGAALATDRFSVSRAVVYQAHPAIAVGARLRRQMLEGRIDAALFLSVRTAATFRDLIMKANILDACSDTTAIVFSGNIAEALRPLRFRSVEIVGSLCLRDAVDALLRVRADVNSGNLHSIL